MYFQKVWKIARGISFWKQICGKTNKKPGKIHLKKKYVVLLS